MLLNNISPHLLLTIHNLGIKVNKIKSLYKFQDASERDKRYIKGTHVNRKDFKGINDLRQISCNLK